MTRMSVSRPMPSGNQTSSGSTFDNLAVARQYASPVRSPGLGARLSPLPGRDTAYHRVMFKAVIFDLGGVLSSAPSMLSTLAERIGTTERELSQHFPTGRDAYDGGASLREYWAPLLGATGASGNDALFQELATLDAELSVGIRPAARALLADCHASGITVAILSNAPRAMQAAAEAASWRSEVDHLFISATMGLMKPDPAIYAAVADKLGLTGSVIAFVDDRQDNIDGALAAGWEAHLWVSDAQTRTWLEGLGVL